jgi:hypothetical protein
MFQKKMLQEKSKHVFCYFPNIVPLWNKVEEYGGAGQTKEDNIIWRMCFAFWISKATDTYLEYEILIVIPR